MVIKYSSKLYILFVYLLARTKKAHGKVMVYYLINTTRGLLFSEPLDFFYFHSSLLIERVYSCSTEKTSSCSLLQN